MYFHQKTQEVKWKWIIQVVGSWKSRINGKKWQMLWAIEIIIDWMVVFIDFKLQKIISTFLHCNQWKRLGYAFNSYWVFLSRFIGTSLPPNISKEEIEQSHAAPHSEEASIDSKWYFTEVYSPLLNFIWGTYNKFSQNPGALSENICSKWLCKKHRSMIFHLPVLFLQLFCKPFPSSWMIYFLNVPIHTGIKIIHFIEIGITECCSYSVYILENKIVCFVMHHNKIVFWCMNGKAMKSSSRTLR